MDFHRTTDSQTARQTVEYLLRLALVTQEMSAQTDENTCNSGSNRLMEFTPFDFGITSQTPQNKADVNKLRITVVSDLHIKNRTWQNYPAMTGDVSMALEKVIKTSAPCHTMVLAGDLFHTPRPSSEDAILAGQLFYNANKVFFIDGNHEKQPVYAWASAINMYTERLTPHRARKLADGLYILGADYERDVDAQAQFLGTMRQTMLSVQEEYPSASFIAVIHQAVDCFMGRQDVYTVTRKQLEALSQGLRVTWICGHIHVSKVVETGIPGVTIISPGSLYPLSSDELSAEHGYVQLTWDGKSLSAEKVPVKVRSYSKLRTSSVDAVRKEAERLWEADKEAVLLGSMLVPYLRVVPEKGTDPRSLRLPPTEELPVLVDVVSDVVEADDRMRELVQASEQYSFPDAVSDECGDDQELRSACLDILASDDTMKTISGLVEKITKQ